MKAQGILSRRSWTPGQESECGRLPRSEENEDRKKDAGEPNLYWNKGILLAEMHAYISSVKWLLSHYKEWNSTSCNKMDSLIHTRSLKRVTERNPSRCPFPWSQSWELRAALLIPVFEELIRNRETLRNGTHTQKMQHIGSLKAECLLTPFPACVQHKC